MTVSVSDDRIKCGLCGHTSHSLVTHVREAHSLTPEDYSSDHGPTVSQAVMDRLSKRISKRRPIASATDLTVTMMGVTVPVDAAVPMNACLPLPPGYRFPTAGKAKKFMTRVVQGTVRGRNLFIWGMPGTGKDAVVHAVSAMSRRPVVMVTFRPGTDLAPWFYTRSIDKNGTGWEYGHLWNALTDGIEGRDGVSRPAIVLLSDVDRADSAQAEWFRILTDSIAGRILGPDGRMHPIFPGTQFICTANSCGTGDARGRMASANPMDASILDRLGRKIKAEYMDWSDESIILRDKYPLVAEKAPWIFDGPKGLDGELTDGELGHACKALRKSIEDEEIYAEFTHRGLCEVLAEAEDVLFYSGKDAPKDLLKKAFPAWLDGIDDDSRLVAKRLIDPHIGGGAFDS
jgi:MoxR-like ATPase